MRSLDFWQIIYKEEQRSSCYPFAKVYFNDVVTDYFENDVICKIVPHSNADLISVCSWRLKQKRGDSSTPIVLNNKLELHEEEIKTTDFDVAILTPRRPGFRYLYMAANWHGASWTNAFGVFLSEFLNPRGINVPYYQKLEDVDCKYAIHENHFIADAEIYDTYVRTVLQPAIEFMAEKEVFKIDSGYVHKKRDPQEVQAYQKASGRQDWPIAPFILERLFSIWINNKPFKVINL